MSHEESVPYFKRLENLEKIRHTNGQSSSSLPVDYKKTVSVTSSIGKSSENHKGSNMWCHYCDKNNHNTADCREIAKFKQQKGLPFKQSWSWKEVFDLLFRRNYCTQRAVEA
jgi:hypothetical protein